MAIIREEWSNSQLKQLLPPVATAADKDDIAALDTKGFDSASFMVFVGAADVEPTVDIHLQVRLAHSENNVDFVNCTDSEMLGTVPGLATGTFAHLQSAPEVGTCFTAAYIGPKRYVRPVIKATGNLGGGVVIGIGAMLHGTKYRPVA